MAGGRDKRIFRANKGFYNWKASMLWDLQFLRFFHLSATNDLRVSKSSQLFCWHDMEPSVCVSKLHNLVDALAKQSPDQSGRIVPVRNHWQQFPTGVREQNSVPFTATMSVYYPAMVDAIAECGVGYKAPSYDKLRFSLLVTKNLEMSGKRRDAPFCQISGQMGGFSYLDTPHYSWVLVLHIVLIICWRISVSRDGAVQVVVICVFEVLRIVDGDMPAMGYIYEGIERAKVSRLFIWKKILFANNIYMSSPAIWAA
ncbi:hypothetical protein NE237_032698 [Protea cynaroides]|uniref:Uncharacterized protein n=1 Tax=Protea cynaroides TaxID=273540 RepID=A0A9Q0L502_9MAGN|nr:hypothetical protein NE237_032698 [Protea cynaroides]